jgi:hypothetical protein
MCAGELVLDLPCLGIYLGRVQVAIVDCMNRNVRGTTGMEHVDVVFQDVTQLIDPSTTDRNDGPNLALWISVLEKIDYNAFRLLPFGTSQCVTMEIQSARM